MIQHLKTSLFVACAIIILAQSIAEAKKIKLIKKRQISGGISFFFYRHSSSTSFNRNLILKVVIEQLI
jgi:hypothetical protein